jgi:hypothetical protein
MRVFRFETDDGERVIGRVALAAWVNAAFDDAPQNVTAADAWTALCGGRTSVELAGGIQLRRVRAMGEYRIELSGFTDGMVDRLKAIGLVAEIVSWRLRLYVPMATGTSVLGELLQLYPLQRIADRAAA